MTIVHLEPSAGPIVSNKKNSAFLKSPDFLAENKKYGDRLLPVTDPVDPRVGVFQLMRDSDLKPQGLMILDSEKVVCRAIRAGYRLHTVFASLEYYERHWELLSPLEGDFYVGSRAILQDVVGHRIHQGMMAVAERPSDCALADLGDKVVVLDGLVDASNVGAIVRACHGFGIDGILVSEKCPSPYVRRAVRVSMGSVFKMPVRQSSCLTDDLSWLKWKGWRLFGTGDGGDAASLRQSQFPVKSALVIGNEGDGVSERVQAMCDETVRIPLVGEIDSLNAACAASVLLYEMTAGATLH